MKENQLCFGHRTWFNSHFANWNLHWNPLSSGAPLFITHFISDFWKNTIFKARSYQLRQQQILFKSSVHKNQSQNTKELSEASAIKVHRKQHWLNLYSCRKQQFARLSFLFWRCWKFSSFLSHQETYSSALKNYQNALQIQAQRVYQMLTVTCTGQLVTEARHKEEKTLKWCRSKMTLNHKPVAPLLWPYQALKDTGS